MIEPRSEVCPPGLPPDVINQLGSLAKTRAKLYAIFIALLVFAVVVVFSMVGATPRACWLFYVEPFLPLPEFLLNPLLRVAEENCLLATAWVLVLWLIRRTLLWVKAAEQEYAFQAWQRTPMLGENRLETPLSPLGKGVRRFVKITPPQWLTGIGFIIAVSLLMLERIFPQAFLP